MPGKLLRELQESETTGPHAVKRSSSRKEQRKEKRLRSKSSKMKYRAGRDDDDIRASSRGRLEASQEKKKPRQALSLTGKKQPAAQPIDDNDTRKKPKLKPVGQNREKDDPEIVLQRQLAKKLGLKDGKLGKGPGDGLDDILQELDDIMQGDDDEDFGSDLLEESGDGLDILDSETDVESWEQGNIRRDNLAFVESKKRRDLEVNVSNDESESSEVSEGAEESESEEAEEPNAGEKYVPPALRMAANSDLDEEQRMIQRRVRGLINRIAETNMKSIVG